MKKYLISAALAAFLFSAPLVALADHEENPQVTRFSSQECVQAASMVRDIVQDPREAQKFHGYMESGQLFPEYLAQWKRFLTALSKLDPMPEPEVAAYWFLKECYERHGNPEIMFQGKEMSPKDVMKRVTLGKPA
jgi:hypothetical protein